MRRRVRFLLLAMFVVSVISLLLLSALPSGEQNLLIQYTSSQSKLDVEKKRSAHFQCPELSPTEVVNFPNCKDKLTWFENHWNDHPCYQLYGVNGSCSSFRNYLSLVENYCPPLVEEEGRKWQAAYATPNFNLSQLFARFEDTQHNYDFIRSRIERMWPSWKNAYRINEDKHAKVMLKRKKLKILLHLGFLSRASGVKFAEKSAKGGPLGELVQWSDLLASLHILGHELLVSTEATTLGRIILSVRGEPCPSSANIDLIFTDIMGLRTLKKKKTFFSANKCKLRLLDSFGTQAQFNSASYYKEHTVELAGKKNPWGGHGLALQQFLTLYPHTTDNTFLGFVVNVEDDVIRKDFPARTGALVYGKEKYMWEKSESVIRILKEELGEVHATVADVDEGDSGLIYGVTNHGLLNETGFHNLLATVRVFFGLGFPFEGPAPLEAIAQGAVFINPQFSPPQGRLTSSFFAEKPTLRALTSQCPYLEEIGPPWVRTVDINNEEKLRAALRDVTDNPPTPHLPEELTAHGMLLRVAVLTNRLDTCVATPPWPPFEALRTIIGNESDSCDMACVSNGLRCEPSLFPRINRKEVLERSMGCKDVDTVSSIVAPFGCSLQEQQLLYSCSAAVQGVARLCPCRHFFPNQKQLCEDCL